jgi:hypothetical protein
MKDASTKGGTRFFSAKNVKVAKKLLITKLLSKDERNQALDDLQILREGTDIIKGKQRSQSLVGFSPLEMKHIKNALESEVVATTKNNKRNVTEKIEKLGELKEQYNVLTGQELSLAPSTFGFSGRSKQNITRTALVEFAATLKPPEKVDVDVAKKTNFIEFLIKNGASYDAIKSIDENIINNNISVDSFVCIIKNNDNKWNGNKYIGEANIQMKAKEIYTQLLEGDLLPSLEKNNGAKEDALLERANKDALDKLNELFPRAKLLENGKGGSRRGNPSKQK